ncbi:S49 family peptidase [Methylomonas sp. 2BW1-5-20]|uniref:S49 family peptidase n=1 Tax=Methylomonas sp. 2BW1-5-20 TaxID=3376686 RepID=UPI004052A206
MEILDLTTPLACDPYQLQALVSLSPAALTAGRFNYSAFAQRTQSAAKTVGATAVIPLYGWLHPRGNLRAAGALLNRYLAFDDVKTIVIEIDSSGGSAYGVQELADAVFRARSKKRVVAIANSVAVAGAYWIGSQAGEFYVTPSGEAGGIGIYQLHTDHSKALKNDGVKMTLVSAGQYKTEGNPFEPLSKEGKRFIKSTVDEVYRRFVAGVARGRGKSVKAVTQGMGQGRVVGADDAVKLGMADGVKSFDQLLGTTSQAQRQTPTSRRVAMLAMR